MKQETKSNIEVLILGFLTFFLGFLFLNNKKEAKNDNTEKPDYKEKDMI
jgi:hypothetical protein